jgi:hypothetical protein
MEGLEARSWIEFAAADKVFYFNVFNVYLGSIFSGTVLQIVEYGHGSALPPLGLWSPACRIQMKAQDVLRPLAVNSDVGLVFKPEFFCSVWRSVVSSPSTAFKLLGAAIPTTATFFINFVYARARL